MPRLHEPRRSNLLRVWFENLHGAGERRTLPKGAAYVCSPEMWGGTHPALDCPHLASVRKGSS